LFILLSVSAYSIIDNGFTELEDETIVNNVARAEGLVHNEVNRMSMVAADWGQWDDTYAFVNGQNDEYIANYLYADSIITLQLKEMLFYDADGQLYYAVGVDPSSGEIIDVSPLIVEDIAAQDNILSYPGQPRRLSGILSTSRGNVLIVSNPITKTTDLDDITGTLIVLKYIDDEMIESFQSSLRLPVYIGPVREDNPTFLIQEGVFRTYGDNNIVVGERILKDIDGQPSFVIGVELPRNIHQKGIESAIYLLGAIFIIGIVCCMVLLVYLDGLLLGRVSNINVNLKSIKSKGSLSSRIVPRGDDELKEVVDNINGMLQSLEKAHDDEKKWMDMILSNIISGIMIIDAKTHQIIDVNHIAEDIIGLTREQLIGNKCHCFISPTEEGHCPMSDKRLFINKSERVLIHASGRNIPILKSVYPVEISGKHCFIESFVDMSHIKETEEKLTNARLVAEAASKSKSDFLATMSHELRTPLNSIIGFSELMLSDEKSNIPEKYIKFIGNISASGKHLLSLINNVLDISKIEAGKFDLHLEFFSIDLVLIEIKQIVTPLADKKKIELIYSIQGKRQLIYADKVTFKQILFNLIGNAIKFSSIDGKVFVNAVFLPDVLRVSVTDTGIGLSEDGISKLFKPFIQIDSSMNRKYEGTGLGLFLVKHLVEMHNGRVWVESELGIGSTFFFELPLVENVADAARKEVERHIANGSFKCVLEPTKVNMVKSSENNDEIIAEHTDYILVVEDDDYSRELMVLILEEEGYHVKDVSNGKDALALVTKSKPLAIALDIMMPGMNGWEMLQNLMQNEKTSDVPVIITSMLDEREAGLVCGVAGYFVKPIDKRKFLQVLEMIRRNVSKLPLKVVVFDSERGEMEIRSTMLDEEFEFVIVNDLFHLQDVVLKEKPDVILFDIAFFDDLILNMIIDFKDRIRNVNIPIIVCTSCSLEDEESFVLGEHVACVIERCILNKKMLATCIRKVRDQTK
jgi:PAS domain S-box-containing protein